MIVLFKNRGSAPIRQLMSGRESEYQFRMPLDILTTAPPVFFYKQYVRFLQTVAPDGLLFVRFLEYVRFFTVCQISYVRFSGFGGKIRRIFQ